MNSNESLFINSMMLKDDDTHSISEIELRNRLNELEDKIQKLQSELASLMKKRASLQSVLDAMKADETIPPPLMDSDETEDFSSGIEKAEFVLDLFSPRRDVFASREWSKSKKGVGYYPACGNFLKKGCHRADNKGAGYLCKGCQLFERGKLTASEILRRNFSNKHMAQFGAVGIYPLKDGNMTRFIAIDLDSADWERESRCLLKTARTIGIPMLLERSCSGNGAHLWVFFDKDIPASKARALAFAVIDSARERYPGLSMSSYDRLFPSQDKLSKDGIGNLILLPLVASAANDGRTVFLDEDGNPLPLSEQLSYLRRVHKLSECEINTILKNISSEEVIQLSSEDLNPGWIRRIPKITPDDIKGNLILYLSCGVTLDKHVLSAKAQEAFRRMATISNPEYYRYVATHDGYSGSIPSHIPLYEENERVLKLPRGLFKSILMMLENYGIQYSIENYREYNTEFKAELHKSLYPRQYEALNAVLKDDIGIMECAPGFGKTLTALAIAAIRHESTLIIVSSKTLLEQWVDVIKKEMKISTRCTVKTPKGRNRSVPGSLGGGHDKLSGVIDVVTLQSIASRIENGSADFHYGFVIVDECHHIAAVTMRDVLRNLDPKYVLGLSATPKRADKLEKIVYAECGPVVFSFSSAQLAYENGIIQQFMPCFVNTTYSGNDFSEALSVISSDVIRADKISDDIAVAYREGGKILVLSRRLEQNSLLHDCLSKHSIPSIVLDGRMKSKDIASVLDHLRGNPQPEVLIATDKLLGEGVDIPDLDTLFLVAPFKQPRIVEQCAGRLLRKAAGKHSVRIFDYVDYRIPIFRRMFSQRISIYKKLGYVQGSDSNIPDAKVVYSGIDYLEPMVMDISSAKKEVVLSASFIAISDVSRRILFAMDDASKRGVHTSIVIRSMVDDKYRYIMDFIAKISVEIVFDDAPLNYLVVDKCISWYGELNPMGQDNLMNEQSILRINDNLTALGLLEKDLLNPLQ